jgi:hypothetical protein
MTTLNVHLLAPPGVALRGAAELWLEATDRSSGAGKRGGKRVRRQLTPSNRFAVSSVFTGRVEAGRYWLRGRLPRTLASEGWVVPRVEVRVRGKDQRVLVWLGQRGWLAYPSGDGFVPFHPPPGVLVLTFATAPPSPAQRGKLLGPFGKLGFSEPRTPSARQVDSEKGEPPAADGSVMLLEGKASLGMARALEELARSIFPESSPRVGIPARPLAGGLVVIDRYYVARFEESVSAGARARLLEENGAVHLRTVEADGEASGKGRYLYDLFEFPSGELSEHLERLQALRRRDEVEYAEPDLVCGLNAAGPYPDDPRFVAAALQPDLQGQFTLTLQGFPEAWTLLGANQAGSSLVTVAILDEGFSTPTGSAMAHEDAPPGQIAAFHDFHRGRASVLATGEARVPDHGNRIWGILGARAGNARHIAGIAPGCSFVLAERPSFADRYYAEALLWLGGLRNSVGEPGFAGGAFWAKNPKPADVICCAHSLVPGTPTPSSFSTAIQELATQGRSTKGVIVVYAAGNDGQELVGWNAFAESVHVIAVGNCSYSPYSEQLELLSDSNFGAALEISALGDQAMTLHGTTESGLWNLSSTGGGTSAASATVAGAAALLLADQPGASLSAVRSALRQGALDIVPFNASPQKLPLSLSSPPAATPRPGTAGLGSGLLNVERSLLALRGTPATTTPYTPPTSGATTMATPAQLGSPTQVRLTAGLYGDYVHERDLDKPPAGPNWGFDPKSKYGTAGRENWIKALFSGNPTQVQKALDAMGISAADQPEVKATLSAIDNNIALSVYKLCKKDFAAHSTGAGGASGHTY